MKILIGIMHCIENEFEDCVQSIRDQTYRDFEYFIIENLPNKEAHNKLYNTFLKRKHEFDLFIKIDADMVLTRPTFFDEVVSKFSANRKLQHLCIQVEDFFTDSRIYGLNVYRKDIPWERKEEKVFVDVFLPEAIKNYDDVGLAPAAFHCPNPSPFQSFHFGIHKAVKVLQIDRPEFHYSYGKVHIGNIKRLNKTFRKTGDYRIGIAALGAQIALLYNFDHRNVDFDNPEVKQKFEKIKKLSTVQIHFLISLYSFINFFKVGSQYNLIRFQNKFFRK